MKEEDRRRMGDLLKLQTDFIAHPRPLRTVLLGMVEPVEISKGGNGTGPAKQQRFSVVWSSSKTSKEMQNPTDGMM